MQIKFKKMHGCGNDFIIIDARFKNVALNSEQRILLCDRRRGIGCDQLVMLYSSNRADVQLRIYNHDGIEASTCGNAARCVAELLEKEIKKDEIKMHVGKRILNCIKGEKSGFWVNMGTARYRKADSKLKEGRYLESLNLKLPSDMPEIFDVRAVSISNPHCIFLVSDAEAVKLENLGPKIEAHKLFKNRTNVEFVSKISDGLFRLRVWERGAGITQACGTGAAAVGWLLQHIGCATPHDTCYIKMDGGDLIVEMDLEYNVLIKGEVAFVYEGCIEL